MASVNCQPDKIWSHLGGCSPNTRVRNDLDEDWSPEMSVRDCPEYINWCGKALLYCGWVPWVGPLEGIRLDRACCALASTHYLLLLDCGCHLASACLCDSSNYNLNWARIKPFSFKWPWLGYFTVTVGKETRMGSSLLAPFYRRRNWGHAMLSGA